MKIFATAALAIGLLGPSASALAQDHGMGAMSGHMEMKSTDGPTSGPEGQAAFAAINDVIVKLRADPATDWNKVKVDALREHLIDMDNVFIRARVTSTPVPGGARFEVSGDGSVRDSIRRMVASHTAMANGEDGRHVTSAPTTDGATLTVAGSDVRAQTEIRALGFFGLLTGGVHHQKHHLMMAKGEMHH